LEQALRNILPVSVIIPTYMRDEVLWRSVEALRPQLEEGDELLLVDQNRPPLRTPPDISGPWLRRCELTTPSLTRARNLGIRSARNGHCIFLDDDIVPDPNLILRFKKAALRLPGHIITGIVDQEDKSDAIPTPGSVDRTTGEIRTNFSRPIEGPTPFFPGGLFLAPKACLPREPWFCPSFKGASQGEEIDFAFRVGARGVRIHADPSIRIFHLKAAEGGCRSPAFRRRFFLDNAFNQALFFGAHGSLIHTAKFAARLKGFIGFHSRKGGGSRSFRAAAEGLAALALGLAAGIRLRMSRSLRG